LSRIPAWVEVVNDDWCLIIPAIPPDHEHGYLPLAAALSAGAHPSIVFRREEDRACYALSRSGKIAILHAWSMEDDLGMDSGQDEDSEELDSIGRSWAEVLGGSVNQQALRALHSVPFAHPGRVLGMLCRLLRIPDVTPYLSGGFTPSDSSLVEKLSWRELLRQEDPDEPRWISQLIRASESRPPWYRVTSGVIALAQTIFVVLAWRRWSETGAPWMFVVSAALTVNAVVSVWGMRRPAPR
jgi:hypothetical protein